MLFPSKSKKSYSFLAASKEFFFLWAKNNLQKPFTRFVMKTPLFYI